MMRITKNGIPFYKKLIKTYGNETEPTYNSGNVMTILLVAKV
jgi:hypothetical protein